MIPTTPNDYKTILTLATVPPRSEITSLKPKYEMDVYDTYISVNNVVFTTFGNELLLSLTALLLFLSLRISYVISSHSIGNPRTFLVI